MSNMMIIETSVLKDHLKGFKGSLKEKLKFAMQEAHKGVTGLVVLSPDEKFRVAVGATILSSEGEDKERLEWEAKCLQALSGTLGGLPINVAAVLEDGTSRGWEPFGFLALWKEVCNE